MLWTHRTREIVIIPSERRKKQSNILNCFSFRALLTNVKHTEWSSIFKKKKRDGKKTRRPISIGIESEQVEKEGAEPERPR